jgi:hypothetical protein
MGGLEEMTKASTIEKNQELIAGFKTPEEIISSRMQSDQKAKREPNALVYDMRLGWAPEYIDNPIGHRKSFRNKRLCPIIRRWKQLPTGEWESKIEPVPGPEDMEASPQSLYRMLHWEPLVKSAFGGLGDIWQKLKVGLLVVLVGIGIFALYLFTQS